jgi:hypothetical protein
MTMMKSITHMMEFLTWINRILFPGDFEKDMVRLGLPEGAAFFLAQHVKEHGCIVQLYQDYCMIDRVDKTVVDKWLKEKLEEFNRRTV